MFAKEIPEGTSEITPAGTSGGIGARSPGDIHATLITGGIAKVNSGIIF